MAGVRQQVKILWNANNTFAFERINWGRLAQAAIITTVSRYMKHLMQGLGVNPLVIPNGLSADTLLPPQREAVASFKARVRGRTVVCKVARWDPDKSWLLAIDTVDAMKRVGWQPLDSKSPLVLFHSAAAVLANSQHEPFGLVGLETMAAGGVACTGYTGEDYAIPGHNALALKTNDPQEFLDLFGTLRLNLTMERALPRAGRVIAQHYTWSQIVHRILLPRLHLIACSSNGTKTTPHKPEKGKSKLAPTAGPQTNILYLRH